MLGDLYLPSAQQHLYASAWLPPLMALGQESCGRDGGGLSAYPRLDRAVTQPLPSLFGHPAAGAKPCLFVYHGETVCFPVLIK